MECKISGCEGKVYVQKHRLCSKHYNRLRTSGSTDDGPRARLPLKDRFWRHVEKTSGCWNWVAGVGAHGYGLISDGGRAGKKWLAHRYSWTLHNGPIPEHDGHHGTVIMHTCDNRRCVNPSHLVAATQADNVQDMHSKGRAVTTQPRVGKDHPRWATHCKRGHEYNAENTYISPSGRKTCRACKRELSRAAHRRKRGDRFGVSERTPVTHCKHGHEYTPENTYLRPDGFRECRVCRARRVNAFYAQQ